MYHLVTPLHYDYEGQIADNLLRHVHFRSDDRSADRWRRFRKPVIRPFTQFFPYFRIVASFSPQQSGSCCGGLLNDL